ncbi:multidrug ABC transporter permease ATP-binding protein [Ligilactobacillus agilis DSM 20509]|uniref:Multidrug ABC transporter permease ATP-binding protein n=1 Tax=Ligilactobacillus agilis DSM 20509 TaxID=1423718 RepID=A0A0R2AQS7_9LACO|nr:ABC transporter permease [Ligilactobacillus agilis]KRM66521.1 multidrug ABC transporter permease ATP-binding protein [Ligilactobacillus agilis DSM 20509]
MEILRPHLQRYWQEIVGAVLAVIVAAVTALWQPHLLQAVLNAILTNDGVLVKRYGIELIVVALIGILAGVANVFFAARLAQGVTSDLREETYRKIQTFSFGNIEHFSSGSLVVRLINDMNQITNFVMTLVMQLIRVPVLFAGSFILGVVTIPRLWWVEVSLITIIVLVAYFIFKRMGALFERVQTYMDKVNLQVKEELQGIRVVKSFNQEGKQQADFNQTSEQLNQVDLVIGYLFSASFPAFTLVSYLGVALAIYLVAQTVTIHPHEIAALSAYITYLTILTMAIIIGGMTSMAFSRGLVSLGRIKEVLVTKPDVEFEQSGFKGKLQGNVTFKEVSFAYPDAVK